MSQFRHGETRKTKDYERLLIQLILNNSDFMSLLLCIQKLEPLAYLSAGVIRNWVWSLLHQQNYAFTHTEIDVIFYDQSDSLKEKDLELKLSRLMPQIRWDVTNQATVHQWYKTHNDRALPPLTSIEHALSFWPETATAVAVRLNQFNQIEVIAPFGLSDLFELKLRWNGRLVPREVFEQRLLKKAFLTRWPKLIVVN